MGRNGKNTRVVAYRLDGSLFRIYESAKKACASRHAHPRTVDKCIRGDTLTAFGYIWRRYEVDKIPQRIEPLKKEEKTTTRTPIALIDDNGEIVKHYSSIKKAAIDNDVDPHSIREVLKKKHKGAKGKIFRYLTREENIEFGYENIKEIDNNVKPIIQYTLSGKYVKTYSSINEAAKSLGKNSQLISECLKGKYCTAYGYIWKYKNLRNVTRKKVYIYQYDLNKNYINKYPSIKEAAKENNTSAANINNAIRGNQKSAAGFIWKRK